MLRTLRNDLRDLLYALRSYRRTPGVLLAALLTLAVGLGGFTLLFAVAEVLVWRPISYPEPHELVLLRERNPQLGFKAMVSSPANFRDYTRELSTLESLAAYRDAEVTLLEGTAAERLPAARVSGEFFETLGVAPLVGTTFVAEPGGGAAEGLPVVLGEDLWQRRFGGDSGVLGRSLRLDGVEYIVVGVMPAAVRFPASAQLWIPLELTPEAWADRQAHYLRVVGRLAPGVSRAQAEAELALLSARLETVDPANQGWSSVLLGLQEEMAAPLAPAVRLLLAAGALLLAVACGNVSNLLLARLAGRGRQMAVRSALGAGLGRLRRLVLAESVVLTLGGALAGLGVAGLGVHLLRTLVPALGPRWPEIAVSGRVVIAALAAALVSGLAAGLAPAWRLGRLERSVSSALAGGSRGTSVGWRRNRLTSLLAASQITLSFVLLLGSALLLRSFDRLSRVDPGFAARSVLTFEVDLPASDYPEGARRLAFFSQALERLENLPGAEDAALVTRLPLSGASDFVPLRVPGTARAAETEKPEAAPFLAVSPGYFETLRIPVRAGRAFAERDLAAAAPAVVVSESLARRFFAGENPVGREIHLGLEPQVTVHRVLGVVADVRSDELAADGGPLLYGLYDRFPPAAASFCLRTSGDPLALAPAVRQVMADLDPQLPVEALAPLEHVVRESLADRRLAVVVMTAFAGAALLLAAVGLYALLNHVVTRSRREIGVRMALGADAADVRRLILAYAGHVLLPGLAAGAAAALLGSRLLASQLFGVGGSDPASYLAAGAVLALCALLACWLPARRAARVDPAVTLAAE